MLAIVGPAWPRPWLHRWRHRRRLSETADTRPDRLLGVGAAAANVQVRISLADRKLWVVEGSDTLYEAPVAVASNRRLAYAGREWRFATPRGRHAVLGKRIAPSGCHPIGTTPKSRRSTASGFATSPNGGLVLGDGRRLVVRDSVVGLLVDHDQTFAPLPLDEHVVFDSTLYIPPIDTRNREVVGPLGAFALDLGDGYMLHGTDDPASIGTATTHGCIRLGARDIAWLFSHVPIGAEVKVF